MRQARDVSSTYSVFPIVVKELPNRRGYGVYLNRRGEPFEAVEISLGPDEDFVLESTRNYANEVVI